MTAQKKGSLQQHLIAVKEGNRIFENAFQGVVRMILEQGFEKVVVNGKTTYDFNIFRTGRKHPIGMYDEINSFVSFVKDAAEGGSSKEMAFVLVGEPGNGKTDLFRRVPLRPLPAVSHAGGKPQVYLPLHRHGKAGQLRPDQRHRLPDL